MARLTKPMERRVAKRRGLKRYYTGSPCVRGHKSLRHTSTGGCLMCIKENHQTTQREKRQIYDRAYGKRRREAARDARAASTTV